MREVNKRYLIVCQGDTEYYYCKSLKESLPRNVQRKISIEVAHDSKDLSNLIVEAIKRRNKAKSEKNPYTGIWLVFDHDNYPRLEESFTKIEKEGFKYVFNSICIEYWFILHFEKCGRAFHSASEASNYLKQGYWPEYRKTKINHYQHLKKLIEVAIANAQNLRELAGDELKIHERNPYSNLDELIDFINKLQQ